MTINNLLNKSTLIPFLFLVAACGNEAENTQHSTDGMEAGVEAQQDVKGPNGGKLLTDGNFALELTIFEAGTPPQFRLFAYENDIAISAQDIEVTIELGRLDGEKNVFSFTAENGYLTSPDIVTEPHSFDVTVKARYKGKTYGWSYPSYEGRTDISDKVANEVSIEIDHAGPQTIAQTIEVFGAVEFAPSAQSTLKPRYPGTVLDVYKSEGETVKKGDLLARIENSQSLRPYDIRSPMDGIIVRSHTRTGDVVTDSPLFIIGDLTNLWADFHIYPGDLPIVRPGQPVRMEMIGGPLLKDITLDEYLPAVDVDSQTLTIHAPFSNPDRTWLPGMKIKGTVTVANEIVPLAVKTEALQRFRDFTVVFAKVGETYEVRMLEIGRQNAEWTEVLGGIKPGQAYAIGNSFIIKADIEKSGASHDH
ncbi:efflux RND transporter periplasmic adaptor subunit [Kordiimonas sp. SCSIO 12603]|uniref:efflux RND transporter periplasmic adaptor subunit n=1 Tax=Kordiimonas sp. SCSIO 12603 TaxID=2829596 RepID=UPI002103BC41|nr:efflux RND transporter periplasmic adaptor subunit [Kordiimonas sp. SCSIO 12603]UTW58762.1 efflux RND transporter periplasmic adaptor subunit [Kordiimonas sp. SCSIO 12603]